MVEGATITLDQPFHSEKTSQPRAQNLEVATHETPRPDPRALTPQSRYTASATATRWRRPGAQTTRQHLDNAGQRMAVLSACSGPSRKRPHSLFHPIVMS